MNIIIAKSAGFCWGVRRAVEKARKTANDSKCTIFTDGSLIHNAHMMKMLEEDGVRQSADPATLPPGSTLLIRAHGISPERLAMLQSLPINLVDATCPDVARIQQMALEHADKGETVLILGDPDHAEVIGLLGFAKDRGRVITSPHDVEALPAEISNVCLVSQSTQSMELFRQITQAVLKRFPEATILNTICNATRNRQGELEKLATLCDKFVVVGSSASANTQRLAQIAAGLLDTVVVDSAAELKESDFENVETVGITAGASTPDFIIEQVAERVKSF